MTSTLHEADLGELALIVDRLPLAMIGVTPALEVKFANSEARRLLHPFTLDPGAPLPDPWPNLSLPEYAEALFGVVDSVDRRVEDGGRVYILRGITLRDKNLSAVLISDATNVERARKAQQEFVANAAHELLTPLTGVVAAAHVLESGAKEVPEDRDQFIAHIARECTRLAKIARALLVLARAQSGEQPPRLDVIPLCEVLEDAVELAGLDGTSVRLDCGADVTVFADPDLLVQALMNLLTNAVRHGVGGTIDVTVDTEQRGKVAIVLSNDVISDGRAFAERRRFETSNEVDAPGFGLGISIARQSVEVLGGALSYEIDGDTVRARVLLRAGVIG